MSATATIDAKTQLLTGSLLWAGMAACMLISCGLFAAAGAVIRGRDF